MRGVELGLLWLLFWCCFSHGRARLRLYLSSWAVRVPAGVEEAQRFARRHRLLFLGQVIEEEPYYHLQHRGIVQQSLSKHRGWFVRLKREPCASSPNVGLLGSTPSKELVENQVAPLWQLGVYPGFTREQRKAGCGTLQEKAEKYLLEGQKNTLVPQVHWFEQQTLKRRMKRTIAVVPTDPWFQKQWYMVEAERLLEDDSAVYLS